MKIKKEITNTITATEGERFLSLSFHGKEIVACNSNLPYEKSLKDWDFYGRAIRRIFRLAILRLEKE